MGKIWKERQDLIKDYPDETLTLSNALIMPGQESAEVKVAEFSETEASLLLRKLDVMVPDRGNELVATMVAEEADSIITLARMVKDNTKDTFRGVLGAGGNLDISWLRAKMVGSANFLNKDGTSSCGVYGGTSGGVLTWLHTETSTGSKTIIPAQTMNQYAGLIYIGAIDPVEVPKVDAIQWTIATIPAPAQTLSFDIRKDFSDNDLPITRFEKPVVIGPEKLQKVDLHWYITGDDKFKPIAFVVAKAEVLTL